VPRFHREAQPAAALRSLHVVQVPNTLLGDNLHPNQDGYTRMAEVFFDALAPYLP
jgi:lysophospholipase L1-like esterase